MINNPAKDMTNNSAKDMIYNTAKDMINYPIIVNNLLEIDIELISIINLQISRKKHIDSIILDANNLLQKAQKIKQNKCHAIFFPLN